MIEGAEKKGGAIARARTHDLGAEASRRAIDAARITASDVDFIVAADMTLDCPVHELAHLLGKELDLAGVPVLTIRQPPAMLFALQIINGLVRTDSAQTILFVEAEGTSGAVALVYRAVNRHAGLYGWKVGIKKGADRFPAHLTETARALCLSTGTPLEAIDWFLTDQASASLNGDVLGQLGVPARKLVSNTGYPNSTCAAALPVLIAEQVRADRIRPGDICMLLTLGSGLDWGCALVRW